MVQKHLERLFLMVSRFVRNYIQTQYEKSSGSSGQRGYKKGEREYLLTGLLDRTTTQTYTHTHSSDLDSCLLLHAGITPDLLNHPFRNEANLHTHGPSVCPSLSHTSTALCSASTATG